MEGEGYTDARRVRPVAPSCAFLNSDKISPLQDFSGYGEIHPTFPRGLLGAGAGEEGSSFFPPDSEKCIAEPPPTEPEE